MAYKLHSGSVVVDPGETKHIRSSKTRLAVWAKTNGYCWYCGESLASVEKMHIEHATPSCQGGSNTIENLYPACWHCNLGKRGRNIEEYRAAIALDQAREIDHVLDLLDGVNSEAGPEPGMVGRVRRDLLATRAWILQSGPCFFGECEASSYQI
jgi:hypothetical protein